MFGNSVKSAHIYIHKLAVRESAVSLSLSFTHPLEDLKSQNVNTHAGRVSMPLSTRWTSLRGNWEVTRAAGGVLHRHHIVARIFLSRHC